MNENLLELYEKYHATFKLFNLLIKLNRLKETFQLTFIHKHDNQIAKDARISKIISMIVIDHIFFDSRLSKFDLRKNIFRVWQATHDILQKSDSLRLQREIMNMKNNSIIRHFLCLYISIHATKLILTSTYDIVPFKLLQHNIKFVKAQQFELQKFVDEVILLLCDIFVRFETQQRYILRSWFSLRDIKSTSSFHFLLKVAIKWIFYEVNNALLRVHDDVKLLFQSKWKRRCMFFLVNESCRDQDRVDFFETLFISFHNLFNTNCSIYKFFLWITHTR